jgi:hypothetical protein
MLEANWLDGVALSGVGARLDESVGRFCPVNCTPKLLLDELPLAADCNCWNSEAIELLWICTTNQLLPAAEGPEPVRV